MLKTTKSSIKVKPLKAAFGPAQWRVEFFMFYLRFRCFFAIYIMHQKPKTDKYQCKSLSPQNITKMAAGVRKTPNGRRVFKVLPATKSRRQTDTAPPAKIAKKITSRAWPRPVAAPKNSINSTSPKPIHWPAFPVFNLDA